MKSYKIIITSDDIDKCPYHVYIRQAGLNCCGFTLFSEKFNYHIKHERAREAEEYILARDDNANFQGFFFNNKRVDISQAKLLSGEIKPPTYESELNSLQNIFRNA